jgi:Ser-tRNA(Ala) deacylase AlaX
MQQTKRLYLNNFTLKNCTARVLDVIHENDRTAVVLDQSVFYPQGGGQPCDHGTIVAGQTTFNVQDVRMADGIVKHFGVFNGAPFTAGQEVTCTIDLTRRLLNSRYHAAGHVLDKVLFELGYNWEPGKSYHFPQGPYVEYTGNLTNVDVEKLKNDIERLSAQWANTGMLVSSKIVDKKTVLADEQLMRRCQFLANVPDDTIIYIISYGDNFSSPCSGTHVTNVSEIGPITIRKIKASDSIVRISYDIAH